MSEQQVVDLLDRVTSALAVDPGTVSAGMARGRRRRRRHLVGTAAASVAVLALTGGGASLMLGGGADSTVRVADPGPTTASADPTPAPSPRRFGLDPAKTGWALGSLLVGQVTRQRAWHAGPGETDDFRGGSVLLDGALVTILIERTTLPRCGELPPGSACDSVGRFGYLSSGSYEEPASGGGSTGVLTNTATFFTADHFAITATAYNAASEKGSAPFLDQPVLTTTQLVQIAQDPVWLDEHQ